MYAQLMSQMIANVHTALTSREAAGISFVFFFRNFGVFGDFGGVNDVVLGSLIPDIHVQMKTCVYFVFW